jgi:hypothetical protein
MLLNPSSYFLPQGFTQFAGAPIAGPSPGIFGQAGVYGGNSQFGYPPAMSGLGQPQQPLGGPFTASPLLSAYGQNPAWQGPFATMPFFGNSLAGHAEAHSSLQQILPVLVQLAQQICVHGTVTQQIGMVLQQLTQQLAIASPHLQQAAFSAAQSFGQNPFASAPAGGYAGFNPQAAQAWGATRPQTVQ